MKIPIVDCYSSKASQQLRKACIEVGFFYLQNHRIPITLQEKLYHEMKSFFHLPRHIKQQSAVNHQMRGWAPMYEETLDPPNQSIGDTKEFYHICRPAKYNELQIPLHGANIFPHRSILPHFQTVTIEYFNQMSALGLHVAQLFAQAVNMPHAFIATGMFDKPMTVLRLLHYEARKSDIENGIFGCGAHSDYGLLTLLSTDGTSGLEIQLDGKWIPVPHKPNYFIVNIGDLAERWTNGVFRSTRHHVVNREGVERYSVPFFYEPNFYCKVECLATCMSATNPPKYPPIYAGENLLQKYAQTHESYQET